MIKSTNFFDSISQHTIFLFKTSVMRLISNRISIDETNSFSLVILGKAERWKESLLLFWLLSWTFCGLVFLTYFFGDTEFHHSMPMLVVIGFWVYFEMRTLKVFFWRRKGFEHIVFSSSELIYQRNLLGRGKKNSYSIMDIEGFYPNKYFPKNFFSFMENSFWVIGGERIYFSYFGKNIALGMQINELEAKKVISLLNGKLKRSKKVIRQKMKQNESGL